MVDVELESPIKLTQESMLSDQESGGSGEGEEEEETEEGVQEKEQYQDGMKDKMKADIMREEIENDKTIDIVGKAYVDKVEHELQKYAEGIIVRQGNHTEIIMEDGDEKTGSTKDN